jgi:SAM-dependent methyltransferase
LESLELATVSRQAMQAEDEPTTPRSSHPRCLICQQSTLVRAISIDSAPALCNELHPTAEAARAATVGRLELLYCSGCGHLFNGAFEASKVRYSTAYENSLHYSERFVQFVDELAQRLTRTYQLSGKSIVDVGCGKGEFLARLCSHSGASGVGFDESFDGPRGEIPAGVSFLAEWFDEKHGDMHADLITCRHVIEHVADPVSFLSDLRHRPATLSSDVLYVEAPNAIYTLRDRGIWDLIYEHASYFTLPSLCRAVEIAGFEVLDYGTSFGGQYIYVEAAPRQGGSLSHDSEVRALELLVRDFAGAYADKLEHWRDYLDAGEPGDTVVWGAGSKGVTFVNAVARRGEVRALVDANPHKHGRYVPVVGAPVVAPSSLSGQSLRSIIVMNPLYAAEVAAAAAALNISADVVVA